MKIVPFEQGTLEWLTWRRSVITATDASAIMGCNPWMTSYKCWQLKLGLIEPDKVTSAMKEGSRLEPIARSKFTEDTGMEFKPAVIESTEICFLGASLDGISFDGSSILEIKCGGSELHNKAKHGIIPDYYIAQMQHQLIVTRAKVCYYYSYYEGDGVCIEVLPDREFEEKYMSKANAFWKCIANFESPPMCNKDYTNMNDNRRWLEYAKQYQTVDSEIKALEDKKRYLRDRLIELCDDHSSVGHGLKVIKVTNKGRVSYEDIPDIDKYRKPATISWKILTETDSVKT